MLKQNISRGQWRWLWLTLIIVLFDQWTKHWALQHLTWLKPFVVIRSLNLTLVYNTGSAFSFLSAASGWQWWLFSGIAVFASSVILLWLARLPKTQNKIAFTLALILGGALGNLIDRIQLGYVVDFIDFYIHIWHWPAFNVADAAIVLGVFVIFITSFKSSSHNTMPF